MRAHMRMRFTTLRVVLLNGYSIEFLVWRGSANGDEVSGKFFMQLFGSYDVTYAVIMRKFRAFKEHFWDLQIHRIID